MGKTRVDLRGSVAESWRSSAASTENRKVLPLMNIVNCRPVASRSKSGRGAPSSVEKDDGLTEHWENSEILLVTVGAVCQQGAYPTTRHPNIRGTKSDLISGLSIFISCAVSRKYRALLHEGVRLCSMWYGSACGVGNPTDPRAVDASVQL